MGDTRAEPARFSFGGDVRLLVRQIRFASRAYRRSPQLVFFALLFPLLFLFVFATLLGEEGVDDLGGLPFNQYYVPRVVALAVMGATYVNLAIVVCARRDRGELKRLRATPLPVWVFVGEMVGTAVLAALTLALVTVVVGVTVYGVSFPGRYIALAAAVVVGAASFAAVGLGVATFLPNAETALPAVNGTFYPLTFISGTFFAVPGDSVLSRVADAFPVRHLNEAVFAAFDPARAGTGPAWGHLAAVLAWGAVGALVAVRRFRWERGAR